MSLNIIAKELGYRDVAHLEMNLDGNIELSKYWEVIKTLHSGMEELYELAYPSDQVENSSLMEIKNGG
jgi:hypothetical protein